MGFNSGFKGLNKTNSNFILLFTGFHRFQFLINIFAAYYAKLQCVIKLCQ